MCAGPRRGAPAGRPVDAPTVEALAVKVVDVLLGELGPDQADAAGEA
jgi:hypothetical protein